MSTETEEGGTRRTIRLEAESPDPAWYKAELPAPPATPDEPWMHEVEPPDRPRYAIVRDLVEFAKHRPIHERVFLWQRIGMIDAAMIGSDERERELRREIVQLHHARQMDAHGLGAPLCECRTCSLWRLLDANGVYPNTGAEGAE